MHRMRLLAVVILSVIPSGQTVAQGQSQVSTDQTPIFKANARVVLVDVVVTKGNDEPVTGLKQEQFQVLEDGRPQTLASFEEHQGIPDVPELSRMAKLPPNVFSNAPLAKAGEAANVLLLDSLNTDLTDQSYVHAQMLKYLKDLRPGTRLAIFTLGDRLRFVQGFTEDPALLMAAMNGKKGAGNPELSSLLQTASEQNANQQLVGQMQAMAAATQSASIQAAASALTQFLSENAGSQTGVRVSRTLEAIDQLAMYLQAIPGRKNVIWFSGSFPLNTLSSDPNMMRDYASQLGNAANLLAAARVAIYPIGVGTVGLAPNRIYDFSQQQPSNIATATPERQMTQFQNHSLNTESTERVQSGASLQEMATNTGGEAFLNSNGFNDVIDHVIKTGTYYYTLTYSPTNQNMDGALRRIQIKLPDGKYKLAYRRGYYATKDFMSPVMKASTSGDPLRPLMDHGTPDATAILYTTKVTPAAQPRTLEPGATSGRAGDNEKLSGTVTRYAVTFTVSPEHLALETSAGHAHRGNVEVTLLAYDRDGIPVNWMVRMLQVRVPRERYEQAQANGVGFNLEMDVPASGVYLRSGIYDMGSNKAGTLEIPLAAVRPTAESEGDTAHPSSVPRPAVSANVPTSAGKISSTEWNLTTDYELAVANEAAQEAMKQFEAVDIPKYCAYRAGSEEHSSSLAAVCEYVLTLRKKLSNVICDRETKRHWATTAVIVGGHYVTDAVQHSDVVTVHVTYHEGAESYSDFRLDGVPVPFNEPGLSGAWSHGEFATLLASIFAPSSKTQFHYSRAKKLHSNSAFIFDFRVSAQNNSLYFLESQAKIWFPAYAGSIWIDSQTSSLLRLQLETAYTQSSPISHAKAEIDYANLLLGDGSSMVLPTNSTDMICEAAIDACARSAIRFMNWHKFQARSHIMMDPTD